jgi:hypothetical protein
MITERDDTISSDPARAALDLIQRGWPDTKVALKPSGAWKPRVAMAGVYAVLALTDAVRDVAKAIRETQ